jgi:nucleotide-binding universal stress UspA family protein
MYEKILVPLDGSELAECALSHVKDLVKGGLVKEVILLNVIGLDLPWAESYGQALDMMEIRKKLLSDSKKYLADVEARLGSEGIKVKTESLEGRRPADIISDYAKKNGMDMIVIATHGYSGLKKLMLGSVSFGILHESHVPVLLIRPESCRA